MRRRIALLLAIGLAAGSAAAQATMPPVSVADAGLDAPTRCLALAVYWEARTESRTGQVAIAHTVLNRSRHDEFPSGICEVVAQKSDNGGNCQFSWWCDGKRDEPQNDAAWHSALDAVRLVLAGTAKDPTGGALYFHSARIRPSAWFRTRHRLARIGGHVFYR